MVEHAFNPSTPEAKANAKTLYRIHTAEGIIDSNPIIYYNGSQKHRG